MRNKIFISHTAPDDNDFTRWLALKLIALGYEVWCDVLFLDKGVDFWSNIEKEIRESACKFLIVSSTSSNQREEVLKELAVAAKVKKQLNGVPATLRFADKIGEILTASINIKAPPLAFKYYI